MNDILLEFAEKNGLVVAFMLTAIIMLISYWISEKVTNRRIPGSAIAILAGLILAFIGGKISGGKKGLADVSLLSGFGLMGGSMFRDFAVVSTAMGASFSEIKKSGLAGTISLFSGIILSFIMGSIIAIIFGYSDPRAITTIGAGACTFIVGPITGAAIGAESDVIALSIATGVVKSILITVATPPLAKYIGLDNPQSAMVYGGLMGTTSGVAAGLAATDPKLVPYGSMTATFYSGLGCLLCPSILYFLVEAIF